MPKRLRIFVSSPTDVPDERLRTDLIVDKLSQDYSRFFIIESYRWEHEAMLASKHFQDAIEPPSAFDIVVLILWSRLGTPLPERTAEREYRGIDGRAPVTGAEWEYEEALKAAREKQAPDLLAFRNISPTPIDPRDPEAQTQAIAQLSALNAFWTRHFVDKGVFLAAYDEYRTLEEFARRLEESLRRLIERRIKALAAGDSREPIWLGDPFRGLAAYEFEHAPIFFGRDAAVTHATEQLAVNARSGRAFLLVSGASGSGKSSLTKAGIVPRLMKPQRISGIAFLRRAVFRPGSEGTDVFIGLAQALTRAGDDANVGLPELIAEGQSQVQLASHLRGSEPGYLFANALGRLTETGRQSGRLLAFEEAKLILVVDQLEELFTVAGISLEDRRLFIQLVAALARSGAVWVIATLRADFWHRTMEIPELLALAEGQGRVDLAAPPAAELAEMIRKPAQAAGLSFEAHPESGIGLDAVLAEHAAAAPGALPLLSFTLYELYQNAKARGEAVLTHASYETLGGLEGAIAKRADAIVGTLPAAAQVALPRVLRALATVSGGAEQTPVARAVPLESFAEGSPARMLVDAFIAARLLVAASEGGASPTVRLAHEALISRWQRARDQLSADRRDLETRALVERQFGRWSHARGYGRQRLLLRNPDLANAVDLVKRWGDELDAPTRDFIKLSARRARLAQTLTAAAAALFAVVAGAAFYAERQAVRAQQEANTGREQAKNQRDQALLTQSRFLADVANQRVAADDGGTATLLALDALPDSTSGIDRPYAAEAEAALFSARPHIRELSVYWGSGITMFSSVFSPDGRTVLTGLVGGTVLIWDPQTDKTITTLIGHSSNVLSARFSLDGKRVVTASVDQTARIWDAATGQLLTILSGHTDKVWSADFSPDGRRVVTASDDGTARIWDAQTGKTLIILSNDSEGGMRTAEFSRDGRRVVTVASKAHIWDAETGAPIIVLDDDNSIASAAFSPDGQHVVTASGHAAVIRNNVARIWDVASGKIVATLAGHTDLLRSAEYSQDGRRIVTASYDGTARVWDASTAKTIATLRGHAGIVWGASFSPDGQRVVTVSTDKTTRIWAIDLSSPTTILEGAGQVLNAEFEVGSALIVTASDAGVVRFWNSTSLKLAGELNVGPLMNAAISPDGRTLATASPAGNEAQIWDVQSGKSVMRLAGHLGVIWKVAFSRDGRHLVTASKDKTARIWDVATGQTVAILKGHEDGLTNAAFSPDGRRVVTASDDGTARIWDAATGNALLVLKGHADQLFRAAVTGASFSPDGRRVATSSYDHTARIWDAETGKTITVLAGHTDIVWKAEFSPDGRRLLTASRDKTARVWDVATGKTVALLDGDTEDVWVANFSPDGLRVITGSWDRTTRLWRLFPTTNALIDDAKAALPRCLTPEERERFFLDAEPPAWCIETNRWPYYTTDWKDWLHYRRESLSSPLPNTPEWNSWIAARPGGNGTATAARN